MSPFTRIEIQSFILKYKDAYESAVCKKCKYLLFNLLKCRWSDFRETVLDTLQVYSEYTYEQKRHAITPLTLQACFVKAHSYGDVITSSCDEGEITKQAGRDEEVIALFSNKCIYHLEIYW